MQPIETPEEIPLNESGLRQRIFLSEDESRQILKDAKLFSPPKAGRTLDESGQSTEDVQLYHDVGEELTPAEMNYQRTKKVLRLEEDSDLFIEPERVELKHIEQRYLNFSTRKRTARKEVGIER